jgi:hypothetical protein
MPEAIQRSHELAQPSNFFELRLITIDPAGIIHEAA